MVLKKLLTLTEFYLQDFSNCALFLRQDEKSEAIIFFSKPKIEPESCVQFLKYIRNNRKPKNTLWWRSDFYIINTVNNDFVETILLLMLLNNNTVNNDFVEILSKLLWFIFGQN